jgi:hypothetical protein
VRRPDGIARGRHPRPCPAHRPSLPGGRAVPLRPEAGWPRAGR